MNPHPASPRRALLISALAVAALLAAVLAAFTPAPAPGVNRSRTVRSVTPIPP